MFSLRHADGALLDNNQFLVIVQLEVRSREGLDDDDRGSRIMAGCGSTGEAKRYLQDGCSGK